MTTTRASVKDTTTPAPRRRFTADTAQTGVLVCIVLLVGLMAGAASFTHVKEWTLDNSPTGTDEWFGWANAVISELIPTAALIEIGRRRRRNRGASVRYPMLLLVGAVLFSLTAQLAVAKPGPSGWVVSALPALAFLGLSKLVFTATATPWPTNPVTAPLPATSPASSTDTATPRSRPAAARKTRATTAKKTAPAKKATTRTVPTTTTAPALAEPALPAADPVPATTAAAPSRFAAPLLTNARTIAASHRAEHGEDISPNQMAVRLKVPTLTATDILTELDQTNTPAAATTRPHNGRTVKATA